MWLGVNPYFMCRQHLLGELSELHMLAGTIRAGKRLGKLAEFVEPSQMEQRHGVLVKEMQRRGYRHNSPLDIPAVDGYKGNVNEHQALADLLFRCPECRANHAEQASQTRGEPE